MNALAQMQPCGVRSASFNYQHNEVQVNSYQGVLYYKAADILDILGYSGEPYRRRLLRRSCLSQDLCRFAGEIWLNEGALFSLLIASHKPQAFLLRKKLCTAIMPRLTAFFMGGALPA